MATLKPYDFSWRSALAPYANDPNTGAFVANWVMGSHQVQAYQLGMQNQSMQTGNEAFGVLAWDANQNKYVMLNPTNIQATSGNVTGNMPTLGNNQFGFFGMHTHPGSATPSGQDYAMTQQLGLDQLVIGTNGAAAIFTNNPGNQWQGAGFEFEDIKTDNRKGRRGVTVSAGGFSIDVGAIPLSNGATAANLSVGWPGSGKSKAINTDTELSKAVFGLGTTAMLLGGPFGVAGTSVAVFILTSVYGKMMYDTDVMQGVNSSPDGRAINGF